MEGTGKSFYRSMAANNYRKNDRIREPPLKTLSTEYIY